MFNNQQCTSLTANKFSVLKQSAFTLIELLVVVVIIGILSAIAFPQYQKAVEKSRAAEALSIMKTIKQAEEIYYLTNGDYTTDFSKLDIDFGLRTGTNSLDLKAFKLMLVPSAGGIFLDAYRKGGINGSDYWLNYMFDKSSYDSNLKSGNFYCSSQTKKGSELCESLGGVFVGGSGHKRYKL
jgi:type IV pilus assembly protein PilE